MNKNSCVIYAPVSTFSGYGANARDKVKALINLKKDEWDIKIISCPWGDTPKNFIEENQERWGFLEEYILKEPLNYQPDYMFWITIPPEAQKVGKWNCLITAGIETDICSPTWLEGCNRMDLVLVSSEHSKKVFQDTKYNVNNPQTNQPQTLELRTQVEVLFEGVDPSIYTPTNKEITNENLKSTLDKIPEKFAYLFTGMWMRGEFGEDRKNVSLLVKAFYETFKTHKNPPALILKTHSVKGSYIDRNQIMKRIHLLRKSLKVKNPPKIYLLHGEFTDQEMFELYNHPKIKAMISLTKGEGFGRPLLEFSFTGKPIITTGYSGHLDFLKPEFTALCGGTLTNLHQSVVVKDMLLPEAKWFTVDHGHVGHFLTDVHKNYKDWELKGKKQGRYSRDRFTFDKMETKFGKLLKQYAPEIAKPVTLKLPKLNKIQLPKLTKV